VLIVQTALLSTDLHGSETRAVAVSPGGAAGATASACPTFSWSAVPGARDYELAVYQVTEDGADPGLVLRHRVGGAALSWTPPLDRCLERGERYAWSVRALGTGGDAERAAWSAPRVFEVNAGPSDVEVEAALSVLRQLQAQRGENGSPGEAGPLADVSAAPASGGGEGTSRAQRIRQAGTVAPTKLSVDGNVAAQTYTGEGTYLTDLDWNSLINVPAGLDDGDDVIVYAAGNQLLLSGTTFNVVEGSGSGLDADMLDGLQGSAYAAQSTTYTKTEVDSLLTVDNIEGPIPAAPELLRLGPNPSAPGKRRLAWNMPSLAGVASFVVYQADFAITDLNKAGAHKVFSGTLHAAVDVYAGSGLQRFRVGAQNVLGEAGPLSAELVIDTTSRLAYHANQDTELSFELYVVPATGGGATKVNDPLVAGGNVTDDFEWSPDGSRLAYNADQDTDSSFELYVVPAKGGGATKVNAPLVAGGDVETDFAWSPDSSRLAYRADQDTDFVFELYVVPATGGGATKVNDPLVAGGNVIDDYAWSPDGSRLAYQADQDTDNVFEIYVVPATGGGATKVNDTLIAGGDVVNDFAWSPDGSRLAYQADQDTDNVFELYVVAATGGGTTKVNDPLVAAGAVMPDFAWSPDGSRLAYRADQNTDNVFEVYVVPLTGGGATKVNDPLVAGGDASAPRWSPLGVP
jgi:hypothetical protein